MNLKEKKAGYFILGLMILSLLIEGLETYRRYVEISESMHGEIPIKWMNRELITIIVLGIPSILIGVFSLPAFMDKRRLLRFPLAISSILFLYSAVPFIFAFLLIGEARPKFSELLPQDLFSIIYAILMVILFIKLFAYYRSASVKREVALVIVSSAMFVLTIRWLIMIVHLISYKSDIFNFLLYTLSNFAFPTAILLLILFIRPNQITETHQNEAV